MAKNVFNEIGATYKVIELDEHNDGRRLQEALSQLTGARTVSLVLLWNNFTPFERFQCLIFISSGQTYAYYRFYRTICLNAVVSAIAGVCVHPILPQLF